MGNALSAGGCVVSLESPSYRPGDVVSGSVFIEVTADSVQRFKGGVFIKVEGREEMKLSGDESGKDNRSDGNDVMRVSVPLNLMRSSLKAGQGQYQYPFSFTLPRNLPPSFTYASGRSKRWAALEYKVSVNVQGGPVLASTTFQVLSQPPADGGLSASPERSGEGPVTDCCGCCFCCLPWCGKGRVSVHVGADTGRVPGGGQLNGYGLVWNASSMPMRCELQLVRHVCIKYDGVSNFSKKDVLWEHVEDMVYPNSTEMHRMEGAAFVPPLDLPTTSTQLFSCRYELVCSAKPSGGCCGNRVRVALPVQVVCVEATQAMPVEAEPIQPVGWSPTVLKSQALGFPAAAPPGPTGTAMPAADWQPTSAPDSQSMSPADGEKQHLLG